MSSDEYIQVKPSRELTNPTQITREIAGLHDIGKKAAGMLSKIRGDNSPPTFECTICSTGKDEPINFYFSAEQQEYIDVLQNTFEQAYPDTFDIERIEHDLMDMLIPEFEYSNREEYLEQFGDRITDWNEVDFGDTLQTDDVVDPADHDIRVSEERSLDLPGNPVKVSREEDGELQDVILAKPELEDVDPLVVEWQGKGDRKRDWMTTIKQFTDLMEEQEGDTTVRSPLAGLIQYITKMQEPCVMQVLFQAKSSWQKQAQKRKQDLHLGRDTLTQKILYQAGELVHPSTRESRREKRRGPPTAEGEDATKDTTADVGDAGQRKQLIDNKHPQYTFHVNIRCAAIATRRTPPQQLRKDMENLRTVFKGLNGKYYHLEDTIIDDDEGRLGRDVTATETLRKMTNREMVVDTRGKRRRSLVLNASELANFIVVPSSKNLTVGGVRQTRATPEARNPLPRPDPDIMSDFHTPGMRVGYALDELSQPEDEPTQVPPSLLPMHYGRFATTGAGKSKAIQNDILSLYENTSGPTILIDPKGDGMSENFLRAFWAKYQNEEERLNDIYYFPVPEVLPGFSFFDIRSDLERGKRRADAVERKADGYEEILKLVMGADRYRESKVAPTIIKVLIKTLFDKEHGTENGRNRESVNYFSHDDLELAARDLQQAANDETPGGRLPKTSDRRLYETLERHLNSNVSDFNQIMDAVFNRLDYIKQNTHLRRIFDNTEERFDFSEMLDEDAVILFDLGELRGDASLVMTGLILTELWDTMNDAANQGIQREWEGERMVNVIIDEASDVAVSDLMNSMLEKGRGFGLSVGLAMQFPKQMKAIDETAYLNVLNNVGTFLIGKIPKDEEVAEAMAHENMSVEEFRDRFKSLPRGEWIGQFPSPQFKQTGPEPFSLDPLPIPGGHPESDNPLTKPEEATFQEAILEGMLEKTERECGIPPNDRSEDPSSSIEQQAYGGKQGETDEQRDRAGGHDGHDHGEEEHDHGSDEAPAGPDMGGGDEMSPNPLEASVATGMATAADDDSSADEKAETDSGGDSPTTKTVPDTGGIEAGARFDDPTSDDADESDEGAGPVFEVDDQAENGEDDSGSGDSAVVGHLEIGGIDSDEPAPDDDEDGDGDDVDDQANGNSGDGGGDIYMTHPNPASAPDGEGESTGDDSGGEVEEDIDHSAIAESIAEPDTEDAEDGAESGDVQSDDPIEFGTPEQESESGVIDFTSDSAADADDSELDTGRAGNGSANTEPADDPVEDDESTISETSGSSLEVSGGEPVPDSDAPSPATLDFDPRKENDSMFVPDDLGGMSNPDLDTADDNETSTGTPSNGSAETAISDESQTEPNTGEPSQSGGEDSDDLDGGEYPSPLSASLPSDFEFSTVTHTSTGHRRHGLTDDEAMFLRTIIDAFNGYNNYPLELPMSQYIVSSMDDVEVTSLEERGYIKRHNLDNRGSWYSPTGDAQQAVDRSCKAGANQGDRGEDMPHRVLTYLVAKYFERLPGVDRVARYHPIGEGDDEGVIDVAALDSDRNILHVAEIEAGEHHGDGDSAWSYGSNNSASVAKDYRQLASADGESWWFVRNRKIAEKVLAMLRKQGMLPLDSISTGPMRRKRKQLDNIDDPLPGLDHIYQMSELWGALEDGEYLEE